MVETTREQVAEALARVLPHFPEVAGAYFFGSAKEGDPTARDVDVGLVLFPDVPEPPGWGFPGLEGRVEAALAAVADLPWDVTVLSRDDVIFAFRVISQGVLAYCRDRNVVDEFFEAVARAHHDLGWRYRQALKEVLSR